MVLAIGWHPPTMISHFSVVLHQESQSRMLAVSPRSVPFEEHGKLVLREESIADGDVNGTKACLLYTSDAADEMD